MPDDQRPQGPKLTPSLVIEVREMVLEQLKAGGNDAAILPVGPGAPPDGTPFVRICRTQKPVNARERPRYTCPFCNKRNKFWDGWVILCEFDEDLRLIGCDCAEDHLGQRAWAASGSGYGRILLFERLKTILPVLFPLVAKLAEQVAANWCWHPDNFRFVRDTPQAFKRLMPELHAAAAAAGASGTPLSVISRVRDVVRSEMQASSSSHGDKDAFKHDRLDIHRVRGAEAIAPGDADSLDELLKRALSQLVDVAARSSKIDLTNDGIDITLSSCSDVEAIVDGAVAMLERIASAATAVETFFAEPNTKGLCRWANHPDNPLNNYNKYTVIRKGIERSPGSGLTVSVRLPAGFERPDLSIVQALRDLLKKH